MSTPLNLWRLRKLANIVTPNSESRLCYQTAKFLFLVVSNVFERITPLLTDFIRTEEFELCRKHSSTLELIRVISLLSDDANMKQSTGAILMNVSKTLDTVCREGVLYKLIRSLPTIVRSVHTVIVSLRSTLKSGPHFAPSTQTLHTDQSVIILHLVYENNVARLPSILTTSYITVVPCSPDMQM